MVTCIRVQSRQGSHLTPFCFFFHIDMPISPSSFFAYQQMGMWRGNWVSVVFILFHLLHLSASVSTAASFEKERISYEKFYDDNTTTLEMIGGEYVSIRYEALQITPDSSNSIQLHYNKAGRIMYNRPFKFWLPDDKNGDGDDSILASFKSTFLINIFRNSDWPDAGHGLAFLIAPNITTIPEQSHGQWLGLTNATTDGNVENHLLAIEFDTERQDFDPDDNHLGLNINSVVSRQTVRLSDHNITLVSTEGGHVANYSVWIQYNGPSKLMEVYMAKQGEPKPQNPLLNETINLKDYLKQDSYFGFAASTGQPQIELNCVLKWSFEIDILPEKKDQKGIKIGVGVGVPVGILLLLALCAVFYYYRTRRRVEEPSEFGKLRWLPGMPREFRYKDLRKATDNFHDSMRLGQGGFGIVYKGILHDKDHGNTTTEIAVKKFSRDSIKSKDDFLAELTIIHRLRHKHLVRLVGWCYEKGKLLLVYDYMPNGSLGKHLYEASSQNELNWSRRYKILVGVASALHYLQNEYDFKVVHRDLKASNILLDVDFNARLGDFGLARALENERNSYAELELGGVPGTMGYVAPECFHTGKATPESDVFGFGAVVLEVVSGRSPGIKILHNQHPYSLVDWVWMLHREGRIQEAVDERLGNDFVADEANRLLLLGLACSHPIGSERPRTQDIFQIISGTMPPPNVPPFKPVFTWPSSTAAISFTESSLSTTTLSRQDCSGTQSLPEIQSTSSRPPV